MTFQFTSREIFLIQLMVTFADAALTVTSSPTQLVTGESVTLTCDITGYTAAEWSTPGSTRTTCVSSSTPPCSPASTPGYTFSASTNAITATITSLLRANDGHVWTCTDLGGSDTGTIDLSTILTEQSGDVISDGDCTTITCESSCIFPYATDLSFTWNYIPDGGTAQQITNPSAVISTDTTGCPASEGKVKSTLTVSGRDSYTFTDYVQFQCVFSQNDFSPTTHNASGSQCFKAPGELPWWVILLIVLGCWLGVTLILEIIWCLCGKKIITPFLGFCIDDLDKNPKKGFLFWAYMYLWTILVVAIVYMIIDVCCKSHPDTQEQSDPVTSNGQMEMPQDPKDK